MNKTSQFLTILYRVTHSPTRCLPESKLRETLDHPPKSTWHRLINELLEGSSEVPALLIETTQADASERMFCLNQNGWQAFMDAHEEGKFLLECYRQVGHLIESDFTNMVFDLPDLDRRHVERLNRKFLHLVTIKAKRSKESKKTLDTIIQCLIGEKQLELTYDGGLRIVRPLTLCQHRDDLYLICYRQKDEGSWEKRTYKLARISGVRQLDKKFPYPPKTEWNPKEEYAHSSGLVLGEEKKVMIRVFGHSRKVMAEKEFFNGSLVNRDNDFDTYLCLYTNSTEFLGQIFVYAQDVEIMDDDCLREEFVNKARAGLERNKVNSKRIA
jgi:predicted DNA-binding transcriptional regulator YafY